MKNSNRSSRIKGESILGLPVIDGKTGKRLGIVIDLIVDGQSAQLQGITITNKGWGKRTMGLPFDLVTVGQDAIIAERDLPGKPQLRDNAKAEEPGKLTHKKVIREDGVEQGIVSDIILDPLTGHIVGLELSDSVFGDFLSGRRILPYEPVNNMQEDILVISLEQAETIDSGDRGIKNILFNKLE